MNAMLSYQQQIQKMMQRRENWRYYDFEFRSDCEYSCCKWKLIRIDLERDAYINVEPFQNPKQTFQSPYKIEPLPKGDCFPFNTPGSRCAKKKTTAHTSIRATSAAATTRVTDTMHTPPDQHCQLPAPIKIKPLEKYLDGCPNKNYIVSGFQNFLWPTDKFDFRKLSANLKPEVIENSIEHKFSLNRIFGPHSYPPYPNFKSSPLALREKKNSEK